MQSIHGRGGLYQTLAFVLSEMGRHWMFFEQRRDRILFLTELITQALMC